jgi:hypothetical protein
MNTIVSFLFACPHSTRALSLPYKNSSALVVGLQSRFPYPQLELSDIIVERASSGGWGREQELDCIRWPGDIYLM